MTAADLNTVRDALTKHCLNTSGVSRSYNPTETYRDNQEAVAALAALDRLVNERDEAIDDRDNWKAACDGWQMATEGAKENRVAAEAEVARLREALTEAKAQIGHGAFCNCVICSPLIVALATYQEDTDE